MSQGAARQLERQLRQAQQEQREQAQREQAQQEQRERERNENRIDILPEEPRIRDETNVLQDAARVGFDPIVWANELWNGNQGNRKVNDIVTILISSYNLG